MTRSASPRRSITVTVATNIGMAFVNAATGILAARLLGPHGEGVLVAIQTWPTFLGTVAMLGLPEALVYFSARKTGQAGQYLGSALVTALLASLLIMALGWVIMPWVLAAQSN